jgi:putative sterol carrier protein
MDREQAVTQLEYVAGRPQSWTHQKFDEDQVFARFRAAADTWREAAEGKKSGAQLLMAGKIKLVKGPMPTAIENAAAFNGLLETWGQIPTDWEP